MEISQKTYMNNVTHGNLPPKIVIILGVMAYLLVLLSPGNYLFCDPDTLMHITAGQWIFDNQAVPAADLFSNSVAGKAWVDHEWLAQLLMYLTVRLGDLAGLRVLIAVLVGLTFAIELQFLLRRMQPIYALLFCAITCACLMGHLLARPHVFTWPIILFWYATLFNSVEQGRSKPPYLLSLVMILWANLHGSFILGLATIPFFALESCLLAPKEQRFEISKQWLLFLVLSAAFSLLTPYGLDGLALGANLLSSDSISRIVEWAPTSGSNLRPIEFWLLLILSLSLYGNLKLTLARLFLLLGLMYEAFAHVRYVSIFGLLIPLILAVPFTQFYDTIQKSQLGASRIDLFFANLRKPISTVLLLGLLIFGLSSALLSQDYQKNQPSELNAPIEALEAAKEWGVSGNLLNYWNFGGFLISRNIPVYIDGRADLYGDQHVNEYFVLTDSIDTQKVASLLEKRQITWTMMPPSERIVLYLNNQKDWKKIYEDKNAVVHVKVLKE